MSKQLIDKMVDRFLGWKLPRDFYPDAGIVFASNYGHESPHWPTGTNLLTAEQARQMFEHVIGATLTAPDCATEEEGDAFTRGYFEGHDESETELGYLRRLILRAAAELNFAEYDNDPPDRVVALLTEMRAVNPDV